ncbi:hypothetical protein ACRPK6_00390 [Exiguobacterium sp. TRN 1102]|uniref:hypothetical protein n=1 Tax=Exiguobacterium sp. TRN 1102 TaxID=3420732 RepID=UPI003D78A995
MSERPLVTMRAEGEARGVKTTVRVGDHTPFIVDKPERTRVRIRSSIFSVPSRPVRPL